MIEKIEEIRQTLLKYLETRVELVKTETQEKVENASLELVYLVILLLLGSLSFLFLLLMLVAFLNEYFESRYLGFVIVFVLSLAKTTVWVLFRKPIQNIIRRLLHSIFKRA